MNIRRITGPGRHLKAPSRHRGLLAAIASLVFIATAAPATEAGTSSTTLGQGGQPALALASPIASLPSGTAPKDTAYAIGKRVFLNGRSYDLSPYWSTIAPLSVFTGTRPSEFTDLDLTRGIILWSFTFTGVDQYGRVGTYRPGSAPRIVGQDNSDGRIAATTGGFTTLNSEDLMDVSLDFWTYDGRKFAPSFKDTSYLQVKITRLGSVGPMFVINVPDNTTVSSNVITFYRSWLVRPTYAQQKLPLNNTYAAGVNWLATRDSVDSSCYRTAGVSAPTSLRARICSQVDPVVSNDGSKVAVVQGRHIRLYNSTTGVQINATNAPTLSTWDATHFYRILRWEDASNYLVSAREGTSLYVLRCNVNRSCQRAVTSYTRSGVSGIVT
jgi:hypothetical protein